jgi:DNA-binding transcriptional regulator YhcF (GntR family)
MWMISKSVGASSDKKMATIFLFPAMSNKLYSLQMKTLGMLLDSEAKTEILRALMYQPGPVGLRQVARIAGVHPHSAEVALAALARDGVVKCKRTAGRFSCQWVHRHDDSVVLEAVFTAAAHGFIERRSRTLEARAKTLLPFIKITTRMINRARGTRHVA